MSNNIKVSPAVYNHTAGSYINLITMHFKNYICILVVLLFPLVEYCQSSTFEYLLNSENDERIYDLIETSENEIIYIGNQENVKAGPKKSFGLVVKLNKNGYYLDSNIVNFNGKNLIFSSILNRINASEYNLIGRVYDTSQNGLNQGIVLMKMDQNLYTSDTKTFKFPSQFRMQFEFGSMGLNNTFYVSGGTDTMPGNYVRPYIYHFNEQYDSINSKFFLSEVAWFGPIHSVESNLLWLTGYISNKYYLLDSLLNITYKKYIGLGLGGNFASKWDTDSTFYLLGFRMATENNDDVGFVKQFHPIDTTGYLFNSFGKQSDTVDLPAVYSGVDFKNKDSIYFGGSSNVWATYYGNWPSWYFVIQTDSLLNIRWERFYGGDAYYVMSKLIATNDGGCLLAGTKYDYENTDEDQLDIYIIKVNSEGLVTSSEDKPALKANEAIVYPNPGTNQLKIRIAIQHPQSVFELYDMNGKQVLSEAIVGQWGEINTTFLPPGTYIYRISDSKGLFESGKWVKQ